MGWTTGTIGWTNGTNLGTAIGTIGSTATGTPNPNLCGWGAADADTIIAINAIVTILILHIFRSLIFTEFRRDFEDKIYHWKKIEK